MAEERADKGQSGRNEPMRAVMNVLASTRTAVVLLAAVAVASIVGTVMSDPVGWKLVYGRLWFRVLLGLLGVNLVACMVWRSSVRMARIWSLLTHLGIILVLVGAMVTLILAERGVIVIHEGQEISVFAPEGRRPHRHHPKPEALGFSVRLVDFRIATYPPAHYVNIMRKGAKSIRFPVRPGETIGIPGTGWELSRIAFAPDDGDGLVEVTMADESFRRVPAKVGTTRELDGKKLAIKILRHEPSFKIDVKTKKVTSDSWQPINPALQVTLVRDGKEGRPRWLFAKVPEFGATGHGSLKAAKTGLRFIHPAFPRMFAEARTAMPGAMPSGGRLLILEAGKPVPCPWDPRSRLFHSRSPPRVKEYESEVEVLEEGRVVRRHVIRVNGPLVHKGTKLSQSAYDRKRLRYTVLGVSRDKGVWFVYAGFLATMLGLMGRFYVSPIIRQARAALKARGD